MNAKNFISRFWEKNRRSTHTPVVEKWPYKLADDVLAKLSLIRDRVDMLEAAAQYGWGHTIDFGPFKKVGILGEEYLKIVGLLYQWNWWPHSLDAWSVADVGCFTGGLTLSMAARQPRVAYAVDEIPEHLHQCEFLCEVFDVPNVKCIQASLYRLPDHIDEGTLDLVLLSGVLYHLSDMLVGLFILRKLLKPGGILIIESNAVDDEKQSYANFGRFYAGMWWQPSSLCIKDMCEFMGFARPDVRFYKENRCIARTVRTEDSGIPFKRGLNWQFDSIRDARPRPLDSNIMAPLR